MSPDDVGTLQKCMMRWVLREERREKGNLYKYLEENGGEQEGKGDEEVTVAVSTFFFYWASGH
jgi:hypothetical protein